ncbi:MAG: OmpA family protein [Deltaproteobacteria bacterium]|nr:OmpA family protein [Deltaproteobacteria bacterium]
MNRSFSSLRSLVAATTLAAATLVHSAAADAQMMPCMTPICSGPGFDLRLFRPAVDSKGLFTVNGTDILGAGDFSFGFTGDVGIGLLRAGTDGRPLIDTQITGLLQFNAGIANLLSIGAQVPFHLVSGPGRGPATEASVFSGVPVEWYNPPASGMNFQGIGDITLHAKLRWLRAEYFPVGLAIVLQGGWGPMRGPLSFSGEPNGYIWPSVAVERRFSRTVRADFNLGARIPFDASTRIGGQMAATTYGPSITWGAGISWRPAPVIDLVAETYGSLYLTGLADVPASLPWEVVAGVKIFVQRNSYLLLGGGTRIPAGNAFAAANGRAFLGIIFEPSIGDTDGDGYRDDVDQCINDPEDFDNFQDDDGCSEPDNDRDGILDIDDQCPLIPEDRDGDQDQDGCPEGQEADRDGDGLNDTLDRCPDEPEDRDGFQDTDGCPDPDNDNDGILDTLDNCPNDPEDIDGFQDDDGCPDPDNDQDGILDAQDHSAEGQDCRNDPETFNGVDDEDGCPDVGNLELLGTEIRLREQIQFETDSAEIRPVSIPIIEQMVNLMRENPNLTQIMIEGHTDERAADDHNLRLSNDRAISVMQAIVQRGIVASRLVAGGFGEYCPLDARHNAVAWEKNRRVVFRIIRTEEGRTAAVTGCRRAATRIPADQYVPTRLGPPGNAEIRRRSVIRGANAAGNATPPPAGAPATPSTPAAPVAPPAAGAPPAATPPTTR